MCSTVVQVVYMAILLAGVAASVVALATPGWFEIIDNKDHTVHWKGLFSCFKTNDNQCKSTFESMETWQKATLILIIVAVAAAAVAFVWSCLLCCTCCFKRCLAYLLPLAALVAFALQLSAVIVYGVKSSDVKIDESMLSDPVKSLGYSFILAACSAAAYFVDIFVGVAVVKCAIFPV